MRIIRFFLVGLSISSLVFSHVCALDTRETAYQEALSQFSYVSNMYVSIFSSRENRKILQKNHIPYQINLKRISIKYEEIQTVSDEDFAMRIDAQKNRILKIESALTQIARIRHEFYKNPDSVLPIGILKYVEWGKTLPGDIVLLYQNKMYLIFIQEAQSYLWANPANQEIIEFLYKANFIIWHYDESIRFIELFRQSFPEEFAHTSIACDAFVIATYAKDIKSRRFYNKICSARKSSQINCNTYGIVE